MSYRSPIFKRYNHKWQGFRRPVGNECGVQLSNHVSLIIGANQSTTLWGRPQKWDSVNRALDKFAYALTLLALKLSKRRVRLDVARYTLLVKG